MSLRFSIGEYTVKFKTEYEDGTAKLENISGGGCAMCNLDVKVQQHEKILLIVSCNDENPIEIGGTVLRVHDKYAAVQFTQLSEDNKQRLIKFFAQKQRQQRVS